MAQRTEPRSIQEFERDTAVYGPGSPQEHARVPRQLSWHLVSTAQRRLAASLRLLDSWEVRQARGEGGALHWPRLEPGLVNASPAPAPGEPDASVGPACGPERASGDLSARQREVAGLIRQGLTNAEIAERLILTPGTVANHVAHILDRLNFRSRAQVAAWATEHRLGQAPDELV